MNELDQKKGDHSDHWYHPFERLYAAASSALVPEEQKKEEHGERHQASMLWTY
eukprot:CAMPEP_0113966200 /NCGR_PEP_ID=MMETSP0011_2-20120614/8196_1 /TAXON_ID=101924 /ORGANISM="Rhodosorus marinus" /LENGTH=52 /DNA_ID=CAMNT_0000978853 /DNA_START=36 /DNA_END=194 /DNA_ORIENTATION=- /assembly_acc=CAM_ASM_000156